MNGRWKLPVPIITPQAITPGITPITPIADVDLEGETNLLSDALASALFQVERGPQSQYVFDPATGSYSKPDGAVPAGDVRGAVESILIGVQNEVHGLIDDITSEDIPTLEWQDSMEQQLKWLHLACFLGAVGGVRNLDLDKLQTITDRMEREFIYMDKFADDLYEADIAGDYGEPPVPEGQGIALEDAKLSATEDPWSPIGNVQAPNSTERPIGGASPETEEEAAGLSRPDPNRVVSRGAIVARANQYVDAGRVTYEDGRYHELLDQYQATSGITDQTGENVPTGYDVVRRVLTKIADHCDECVALGVEEGEPGGYGPIADLVPIGDTPCRSNCECHVEYANSKDLDPSDYELGDGYGPGEPE